MRGLHGHLTLTAAADSGGQTYLREQSFAAPVHISKPHHDNGWLVVNMASPSPGLLAGDRVEVDVRVESGARLLLTTPSASRIHTMGEGESATLHQRFRVASGASLDVWPEYVIPQSGACYRQKSNIEVAAGGTLFWTESIAPGRTARGEVFEFRDIWFATDILYGGRPLVRERYRVGKDLASISALRFRFPQAYYASVVCIAPQLAAHEPLLREMANRFAMGDSWVGVSRLAEGSFVAKILSQDSPTLRAQIAKVRRDFQVACGIAPPGLRRVTGELVAS